MREELQDISEADYWLDGLRKDDLDYILRLTKDFIGARKAELQRKKEQAKAEYPDPAVHGEIISDYAYYNWIDEQYLWQFCLWRFQGILEGVITHSLLPKDEHKFLPGLKAKLSALQEADYTLSEEKYEELLNWANLRNALSHAPPEQYRPGPLREDDVLEYKQLIEELLATWRAEKAKTEEKDQEV